MIASPGSRPHPAQVGNSSEVASTAALAHGPPTRIKFPASAPNSLASFVAPTSILCRITASPLTASPVVMEVTPAVTNTSTTA